MAEFTDFLNRRCSSLENLILLSKSKDTSLSEAKSHKKIRIANCTISSREIVLTMQKSSLYACSLFRKLSSQERLREVKRLKVYLNCLRIHSDRECTFGDC